MSAWKLSVIGNNILFYLLLFVPMMMMMRAYHPIRVASRRHNSRSLFWHHNNNSPFSYQQQQQRYFQQRSLSTTTTATTATSFVPANDNNHDFMRLSPICLNNAVKSNSDNNNDEFSNPFINDKEQEIANLNDGIPVNVNSPKQVSMAIFGKVQSTNRAVLLQAAQGNYSDETGATLCERRQRLATLVLECRERRYRANDNSHDKSQGDVMMTRYNNSQTVKDESTQKPNNISEESHSSIDNGGNSQKETQPKQTQAYGPNDSSQYERQIDALFDHRLNKLHDYWRQVLKEVSRASARALVAQLDPTICPMGFNPLAVPHDPLRGTEASSLSSNQEEKLTTTTTTTAGKKGSFLHFCREAKRKHPDCVIVTRCGDFYETFGIDAVMLVEHCGLNPMAGKAKAGFPFRSIQAALDCLTEKGFRIAVYEEAIDTDASAGAGAKAGSKSRLKTRMLAQIISPASPTYMYDLVLLGNTADTLASAVPARPYMGVLSLASGYTLVEVSVEERSVRVSERLTAEAVACRLAAYPPASPLLLVPSPTEYQSHSRDYARIAPFLPSASQKDPGSRLSVKVIPPTLVQEPKAGTDEVEQARQTIVSALLQLTEFDEADLEDTDDIASRRRATINDFTLIASSHTAKLTEGESSASFVAPNTQTHPLHVETATQLGLMNDRSIPSLMSFLLPDSAPASTRRFLRRYILTPPPPDVCEAMSKLVAFLKEDENSPSIPPLAVPPLGKVLSLLRAGQASAPVYGELLQALAATVMVLDLDSNHAYGRDSNMEYRKYLIETLMTILEHESGMSADPRSLRERCIDAMALIEGVVSPLHHSEMSVDTKKGTVDDTVTNFGDLIPSGFLERNEAMWRGRVQPSVASESYGRVQTATENLAQAVAADFYGASVEGFECEDLIKATRGAKNPIVQDVFNNLFALRHVPEWVKSDDKDKYIHPRDRNGKILKNRYTTEKVTSAMSEYVTACEDACKTVTAILTKLSQDLYDKGHIPAVVQASHSNLILSTAFHHARQANTLGWNCVSVYEAFDRDGEHHESAGYFHDLWPYWMHQSEAVPNTFEMKDLFLLTAPNMSGKSTLMRATATAALLANCGLCAPLKKGSKVRRFDHIFVRGASADIPAEHKSAFGAEMADIASLLRNCGKHSLVYIDELARGTSPRDATRLAGAVLEAMSKRGMSGFFATHLHDILLLPLESSDRIVKKRMAIHGETTPGVDSDENSSLSASKHYKWTYRLADGVCTDSMALVTAAQFGLPEDVLRRAEELSQYVPHGILPSQEQVSEMRCNGANNLNGAQINGSTLQASIGEYRSSSMDEVVRLVVETSGQTPFSIPPGWNPPASLEGQSCVYVLQLKFERGSPQYYIGETDALQQRLRQHRTKKGGLWSRADAIAFPVADGKSEARAMESLLIQKMAKAGFILESTFDGRSLRSSRQN